MSSHIPHSEPTKADEATPFYVGCREQISKYWLTKDMPMDPDLDKLISAPTSTRELISALRNYKHVTTDAMALLQKAESKIDKIEYIKPDGHLYAHCATAQLRFVFTQIAANMFEKVLEAEDKEWCIVSEEESEEDGFVLVE